MSPFKWKSCNRVSGRARGSYSEELHEICWEITYGFWKNEHVFTLPRVCDMKHNKRWKARAGVGGAEQNENLEMKPYSLVTSLEIISYLLPFWQHSHCWTWFPMGARSGQLLYYVLSPHRLSRPRNSSMDGISLPFSLPFCLCTFYPLPSTVVSSALPNVLWAWSSRTVSESPTNFWCSDSFFHRFSEEIV